MGRTIQCHTLGESVQKKGCGTFLVVSRRERPSLHGGMIVLHNTVDDSLLLGNKQVVCFEPLPTKKSNRVLRLGDFFSWERNRKGHLLLG